MPFITVNHLEEYGGLARLRVSDHLILKKDLKNSYDDEAIAVYTESCRRCGYVANSVCTVVRGTSSAGRIYDKIEDGDECIIRFISNDALICELTERK